MSNERVDQYVLLAIGCVHNKWVVFRLLRLCLSRELY
jgi:hypothetical protein